MNQADYRTIKIERRGRILYLIMNRPATLNAVDALMHTELARVFRDANDDAESDIVVLTGAGRAFCTGANLQGRNDQNSQVRRNAGSTLETATTLTPDVVPQYKWDGSQYHYNWSTKGLTAGLYRIFANLGDKTAHSVDICLTK